MKDPHIQARGFQYRHTRRAWLVPTAGESIHVRWQTRRTFGGAALGQHNDEVFGGELGLERVNWKRWRRME
jgi:hypothetical protein